MIRTNRFVSLEVFHVIDCCIFLNSSKKREVNLTSPLAGVQGFEPQLADPESAVLPLNDTPMLFVCVKYNTLTIARCQAVFFAASTEHDYVDCFRHLMILEHYDLFVTMGDVLCP